MKFLTFLGLSIFVGPDTRHTFASRMTEKGWSVIELAQQGGWKQLQVLKRYTHIDLLSSTLFKN